MIGDQNPMTNLWEGKRKKFIQLSADSNKVLASIW